MSQATSCDIQRLVRLAHRCSPYNQTGPHRPTERSRLMGYCSILPGLSQRQTAAGIVSGATEHATGCRAAPRLPAYVAQEPHPHDS